MLFLSCRTKNTFSSEQGPKMLLLSRRIGETLLINDHIRVKILGLFNSTDEVRIGIDAPKEISVHREEIHKKIKKGNFITKNKRPIK